MRVLYVSTEVYPALKTGGLADVNAALPPALNRLGADARLLLPGFPAFAVAIRQGQTVARLEPAFGAAEVSLVRGTTNGVTAYFVVAPELYDRPGNPYTAAGGRDWPDNHARFALLGAIAARFSDGGFDDWRPDIVHGHDWHAGLAPAYVAARGGARPGTVFTIHNLSYQGLFPGDVFTELGLPAHFFGIQGLEFYGKVSFMKAGIFFADRVTTVSPSYAKEIQSVEQGCGLDGLLRWRSAALSGILNGVDRAEWNPATDRRIPAHYDRERMAGKAECRRALQAEMGLASDVAGPIVGVVSRLTAQKGLDLLLGALPSLLAAGGQLALLGAGDASIERGFVAAAEANPGSVFVRIGYDEDFAHRIVAGADVIAVPSRFEPCGLTQMYGLAYGTLPLVRSVGGLADTVTDAEQPGGDGFAFGPATVDAVEAAVERMLEAWGDRARWAELQSAAMRADFGWEQPAGRYLDLYRNLRPNA